MIVFTKSMKWCAGTTLEVVNVLTGSGELAQVVALLAQWCHSESAALCAPVRCTGTRELKE